MNIIATHYGDHDVSWIPELAGDDYFIYDRSDCGLPNRVSRENRGDADYDRLSYLVENYDNLPEVFLLTKSNLFKYITREEFDEVKDNQVFTPLLTKGHRTYGDARGLVSFYDENGMYCERNDSWFLNEVPAKYVNSWNEWADIFLLPKPAFIPFAPGGNYILTRETVHKYGRDYYDRMRDMLPYCQRPGEAQCVERSLYLIWS